MIENQYKIKTGDAMQDKTSPVYDSIKAIPHKDCRSDAQSAFSSDYPKQRRNTGVFQGVLVKNKEKTQAYARQSAQRGLFAVLP